MDFSLSEEQHLLVSSIRGFIESELRPLEEDIEKTGRLADDVASETVSYTHLRAHETR